MEVACTEIGASPGVSVTVEKAIAADVAAVRLTVSGTASVMITMSICLRAVTH
jgi:hypothetical protein